MKAIHIPRAQLRPIPDNFADIAPTRTVTELRKMFRSGGETVRRWCQESGVQCFEPPHAQRKGKISHADPPEIVNACLTCPLPPHFCNSACQRLKAAKIAARQNKQAKCKESRQTNGV